MKTTELDGHAMKLVCTCAASQAAQEACGSHALQCPAVRGGVSLRAQPTTLNTVS